jgi:hypothetical protein
LSLSAWYNICRQGLRINEWSPAHMGLSYPCLQILDKAEND